MQLLQVSLKDSWESLKNNWIVLWFPLLIGLGLMLLFGFMLIATMIGTAGGNMQAVMDAEPAAVFAMLRTAGVMVILASIVGVAFAAGQAQMLSQASAGAKVTVDDFWSGARRFFWRFLGGNLLLGLIGLVIAVIFFGGIVNQLGFLFMQLSVDPNPINMIPYLAGAVPVVLLGLLIFLVGNFFIGVWNEIVVVEDESTIPSILASVRVVTGNLVPFLLLAVLAFVVTMLVNSLTGQDGLISLLGLIGSVVWGVYYQIVLFTLYRHITGKPGLEPPVNTGSQTDDSTEPPHLLV